MSDESKGGSDLDVFEGLSKKQSPKSIQPGLTPPPPSNAKKTLLGTGVLPPPSMPPSANNGAKSGSVLPPVSAPPQRSSTATPLPSGPPAPLAPPVTLRTNGATPPAATSSVGSSLGFGPSSKAKNPAVDMDWDDEEESTHVFEKQTHELPGGKAGQRPAAGTPAAPKVGAAAALLASSGAAAKSLPASSLPVATPLPAPAPPPKAGVPARAVPTITEESTSISARHERQAPPQRSSPVGLILGIISLLAVLGIAAYLFIPRTGQLKIDLKTKTGAGVAKAEIFVDGQKKCDTAPCIVSDLSTGPKTIKVIAPGVASPDPVTETIEAGKEKLVMITLEGVPSSSGGTTTGATTATLKVLGSQPGVKLSFDGEPKGTLPTELRDVPPGSHKLSFDGGDRYLRTEQTVEVGAGDSKDIGPIKLKVLKGHVTLELATVGAQVTLVSTGPTKTEKKLPDALWKTPPVKLDIDAAEPWKITATKKGFNDFSTTVSFDDGEAEKAVKIELTEVGKGPAPTGAGPGPAVPSGGGSPGPAAGGGGGNGTLNMNSIPVSKVVLDGKPLGSTPKVGVSVPAGSHTVTFIHPEMGKKSVTVTVKGGETKTAAVKF